MSNYSTQDHQSWPGRSMRDDSFSRSNRDQEQGNWQRRHLQQSNWQQGNWQQEGQQGRNMGGTDYGPYGSEQQDFYEQNGRQNMSSNRGGRGPHRGEPWPRNEDRENYSSVADYGRSDQYFDNRSSNRPYSASQEYGQGYGGQGEGYFSQQEQSRHRGSSFNQSQSLPFSGGQGNYENQSRYGFQQGRGNDWSSGAGYPQGTQSWQEREGAQRGAFGLQSSHRGKGPQGYSRSDERIKEDVCERLSEHHFIDASSINVEVEQGVVTLEGSVPDRWQKYQTEDLIDAISDVKDINNRLNVARNNNQQSSQAGMQQGAQGMQSQGAQQPVSQQGGNQQQSAAQKTSQSETRDKERTKSATTNQTGNS